MCKFVQVQINGINWNDYDPKLKRGRFILKEEYDVEADIELKRPAHKRSRWISTECPTFTQDKEFLQKFIPKNV